MPLFWGLSYMKNMEAGQKLRLSQALAQGSPITPQDIDQMLDFFEIAK
jgi:hypothetical protein